MHATAIKTAQMNLLKIRALCDVFNAELSRNLPAPAADCDDATFDAWNDRYETVRMKRGGFKLDDAKTTAENDLIAAVSAWLRANPTTPVLVLELLDLIPTSYSARTKCLALWMRLDTRTV